jgi:hypothetical protein
VPDRVAAAPCPRPGCGPGTVPSRGAGRRPRGTPGPCSCAPSTLARSSGRRARTKRHHPCSRRRVLECTPGSPTPRRPRPALRARRRSVYNERGLPSLQFWRSVFERRAPESLPRVEQAAPVQVGQGNTTYEADDLLLEALTDAYMEAASGKISGKFEADPGARGIAPWQMCTSTLARTFLPQKATRSRAHRPHFAEVQAGNFRERQLRNCLENRDGFRIRGFGGRKEPRSAAFCRPRSTLARPTAIFQTVSPRNSSSCIGMGLMRPRGSLTRTRERTRPSW